MNIAAVVLLSSQNVTYIRCVQVYYAFYQLNEVKLWHCALTEYQLSFNLLNV